MAAAEPAPRKTDAHRKLLRGLSGSFALVFLPLLPLPASASACMWFADAASVVDDRGPKPWTQESHA